MTSSRQRSIERIPFGRTGHASTRIIFGAAALGAMRQDRADRVLDLVLEWGINHIDVAASYGDAELRLAPFLKDHRATHFLATKTGQRTGDGARAELEKSLQRLEVDRVDLIQLHNLTDGPGWDTAMSSGGALEALLRAQEEGLARFVGVTGHGTYSAAMHLKSLEAYDFASVLVPYNFSMRQQAEFGADLERLIEVCRSRDVAVQTIKSIARRRWTEDDSDKRFSWYMPIREPEPLARAVRYVLARPGLFLNTTSDATLLPAIFEAAADPGPTPDDDQMARDQLDCGVEPLFIRDQTDEVRPAVP